MMDRRRRVLRRDPSPLVQQPFSEYRGLNGLLGLCVSFAVGGGRVVGSGEMPLFQEAVAGRGNLTNLELTFYHVSA